MMAGYWPTPQARQSAPEVAKGMNALPKVVFSRTLKQVSWNNTRLVQGGLAEEVRKMKAAGKDMLIMGSGTLVAQLTQEGLIDEYRIVVNPLIVGAGRTLFEGVEDKVPLKLTSSRPFTNGNVVLTYVPR